VRKALCTLAALAIFVAVAASAPALAQTSERVWEQGTAWQITYVETKPAMFNAYIKDLSQVWKKFLDKQKESGDVISYKMLSVQNTRDGEPDLILMVEWKNMAVFDRGVEYFEEMSKEIMGSLDDMQTANIERGELRTLRGSVLTREIHFKE
jgi:hypothetical protein